MPSSSLWSRRSRSVLAAMAIAVPLLVVIPSADATQHERTATPPGARTIDAACPPGFEAPANDFADIAGNVHARPIRCAAHHRVAFGGPGGRPANQYAPNLDVSRGQMASSVTRIVDLVDAETGEVLLPAWDQTNRFTDVSVTSPHVGPINRLAAAGVVRGGVGGRPTTTFSPDAGITRAQLATFLHGMIETAVRGSFFTNAVYYDDLATVNPGHAGNINALTERGLLTGRQVGAGWRYDPDGPVRRDQMASALMRSLSLLYSLDAIGHRFTEPAPGSGAEPRVTPDFPTSEAPVALLQDVRIARHDGFDRFVLDFEASEAPAHSIRYVGPPILEDGSGQPVEFAGDGYLAVHVTPASGFDMTAVQPTYTGPRHIALAGGNAVTEAIQTGDFEAVLSWTIGVDHQRPFDVGLITGPEPNRYRIVIDVQGGSS
jgi:hypothetical protein